MPYIPFRHWRIHRACQPPCLVNKHHHPGFLNYTCSRLQLYIHSLTTLFTLANNFTQTCHHFYTTCQHQYQASYLKNESKWSVQTNLLNISPYNCNNFLEDRMAPEQAIRASSASSLQHETGDLSINVVSNVASSALVLYPLCSTSLIEYLYI